MSDGAHPMRRSDRAVTGADSIERILRTAKVLHLGLVDEGRPYVVPLHYGYEYEDGDLTLYMHSARTGRKVDVIRSAPICFVEMECDVMLDDGGEIPYEVPCKYGAYYASVMGEGDAILVEDPAEKAHGLELLMANQTGRHVAISEPMTRSVAVIKVVVPAQGLTAKARPRT